MKVIFINNIPAPFMLHFAKRMNDFEDVEFKLIAVKKDFSHRGKHWKDTLNGFENLHYYDGNSDITEWLESIIENFKPDIVYTGLNRGDIFDFLVNIKGKHGFIFGKWNEPYYSSGYRRLLTPVRHQIVRNAWRNSVDFFLAIDDRAVRQYRKFLKNPSSVFFFPYYEDSPKADKPKKAEFPLVFLFSGRLVKLHNIDKLAKAIDRLQQKYPDKFRFIISAVGDQKKYLDKLELEYPRLLIYDTEFEKWNDRLRPFHNAHVLVLPSTNSGWGLVVNEALNLGLPVITSKNVGSARYLVEHMINGMIIKPTVREIYHALEYFVLNPDEIERMSENALQVDKKYSLEIGALRLKGIFEHLLKKRRTKS